MMQPKLRFWGFKAEWHGSSLSKVFNFKNGYNASAGEYGHGVLFINVLDIINNKFITNNDIVGKVNISSEMLEKYSVKHGDILFQRSSETVEEVGQANVYLGEDIVSFGGFVIRGSKKTEDNSLFLNYLLKTSLVRRDIMKRAGGSTRYNIGQESLNEVMVYLPINIEEQVKIAKFLSAVDQKITILEKQQQAWEQYKQGMMQKLFSGGLRFRDENGEDFPEWEEGKLDSVAIITGGGTPETKEKAYWDGGVYWFTPSEIKSKYLHKSVREISEIGLEKSSAKLLPIGTVLFTSRATIGDVGILTVPAATNQGFQSFICKDSCINEFLYYWLFYNKSLFVKKSKGSTFMEISKTEISKILILLPCLEEQKEIANSLSCVDKKIDNINQQLAQIKTWKQGLLQQMFI